MLCSNLCLDDIRESFFTFLNEEIILMIFENPKRAWNILQKSEKSQIEFKKCLFNQKNT